MSPDLRADASAGSGGGREPAPIGPLSTDRSPLLLIAAAVLVVTVGALVVLFGIERPPAVEPVSAHPTLTIPASIAWLDRDGGAGCLRVADPVGDVREVVCGVDGELIAWDDDGILAREWSVERQRLTVIDPATGATRTVLDDGRSRDIVATWIERTEEGFAVETLDVGARGAPLLWRVDAPPSFELVTAVPSPDGSVIALGDNAGRLMVADADASLEPRLWVDGLPDYTDHLWEGTQAAGHDGDR